MNLLVRLCRDDNGQDLVEYALLTAAIAFAGILTLRTMRATLNTTYSSWGTEVNSLWVVNK